MSTVGVEEVEMPVAADDFSSLEERVQRVVEVVKRERAARAEAEDHAAQLERDLQERGTQLDEARGQVKSLEREREQVRQRVERLLKQIDEIAS